MHTSKILRSHHFRVVDDAGTIVHMTADLTAQDRLGVVSPRYEDGISGASAAILLFVTAFYDLQRAQEEASGQPFFAYPDYFAFLFSEGDGVRGLSLPAPLAGGVSAAYGKLDVWPEDKWVVVRDTTNLWTQIQARGITHLLLPAHAAAGLGAIPDAVAARLRATYRYLLPDEQSNGPTLRIELEAEPLEVIAEAVRCLPSESPAHALPGVTYQRLMADP